MEFFAFDEVYLDKLRSGDFRTEQHFVSYFSQLIQLKLRSRVQSSEVVDELRQETFVRFFAVLRGKEGIRQASRVGAFVNGSATMCCSSTIVPRPAQLPSRKTKRKFRFLISRSTSWARSCRERRRAGFDPFWMASASATGVF